MNFKLIKCLILLFLISNISENFGANCSKSTMSASFKSNYKLMLEKNKTVRRGSENVASSASTSASSSASSSASTSIASSNYSLSVKSTESSSDSVATGFLSKKRKLLVPEIPILFEGWAKYFNYIDKGNTKPSNFFINDEYDHLSQEERDSKEKDKVNKNFEYLKLVWINQYPGRNIFLCCSVPRFCSILYKQKRCY